MRISEIYDMDVYGDNGAYLGEVHDAIIDLEKGEVSRLLMEEFKNIDRSESRKLLQNKSVLFKHVRNIGDVVLWRNRRQEHRRMTEPMMQEWQTLCQGDN